jgi:hypothetical protein
MFNFFRKKSTEEKLDKQLDKQLDEKLDSEHIDIRYVYILSWDKNLPIEERIISKYECNKFCGKLLEVSKSGYFSIKNIQNLSQKVGYSVFHRRGGDGCPHVWERVMVQKINPSKPNLK